MNRPVEQQWIKTKQASAKRQLPHEMQDELTATMASGGKRVTKNSAFRRSERYLYKVPVFVIGMVKRHSIDLLLDLFLLLVLPRLL